MRQYLIDELRAEDYTKLQEHLQANYKNSSGIPGVFWIELPDELLNPTQLKHKSCYPFYIAVDLEKTFISFELLVRTKTSLRCECISYSNEKQRNWIIEKVDSIFNELKIVY